MEHLFSEKMSRPVWGTILLCAAGFAIAGALLLESLGLSASSVRPLPFVGAVVFVKLGLFFFWPVIARKGREASVLLNVALDDKAAEPTPPRRPRSQRDAMMLWDDRDPRVDVALFSSNVPTFVLTHEQRFLDWNPAFHLVFGGCAGIERGGHVSEWFGHLENFKKVSVREAKLYGEGILPLADRERATFLSPEFGRMVFTKIMSPIIDRRTGRIIGWNVVLNINSVAKRSEFLERLFGGIARESRRIRYAAAADGLFRELPAHRALVAAHVDAVRGARRVLDLGAGTGDLTLALLQTGSKVTAVDRSVHLLRQLRDKVEGHERRVRIVRQNPDNPALAAKLPEARFDAVVSSQLAHRVRELPAILAAAHRALKPGGVLTLSAPIAGGSVAGLFDTVREHLVAAERYEELKHQLNQALEHEQDAAASTPYRYLPREELRAAVLEAGFLIEDERSGLLDGHTLLLVARK